MSKFKKFYLGLIEKHADTPLSHFINNKASLNFFSSSVMFLSKLGEQAPADYRRFFKEHLLHRETMDYALHNGDMADELILDKEQENILLNMSKSPSVIAGFHYGPHNIIAYLLHKYKVPFSIVISSAGYTKNAENFSNTFKKNTGENIEFIDAEKPSSLLSMIKTVKSGKSLLILLDFNKGLKTDKESLLSVDFLNTKLNVRKGAAFIAHVCNVPLRSLITYVNDDECRPEIYFTPPQVPTSTDRETFIETSMKNIFSEFEKFVYKYPAQWEVWTYLKGDIELGLSSPPLKTITIHNR